MNVQDWLQGIKELTESEYLKAEETAKSLVRKKNGEQPTLSDFRNSVGGQFNIMVVLMFVVFSGALFISTFDIVKFVGQQVYYNVNSELGKSHEYLGFQVNQEFKAMVFQASFVVLAEFSAILFLTRWRQETKLTEWKRLEITNNLSIPSSIVRIFGQFFNIYFWLALFSISFVFYANWQSGVHWFLAILPPIMTLGCGWVFEELITDWLAQKELDEKEFNSALFYWSQIDKEPEQHPQYQEYFWRSLWGALKSKNQRYGIDFDVNKNFKLAAIERELDKSEWAKNGLVRKAYQYDHPEVSKDKVEEMSDLEIVRDLLNKWNKNDGYKIESGDYIIDLKKNQITNKVNGYTDSAKTLRGLKHKVTTKIKEQKGVSRVA